MKKYIKYLFITILSTTSGLIQAQNLSFSGGNAHSVMMCSNGEVYTMGNNTNGQLGTNGAPAFSTTPIKVLRGAQPVGMNNGTNLGSIRQVDAGSGAHTIALACNGTVWTWGWNTQGQLGDNTVVTKTTPVQVWTGVQGDASGFLQNVIMVTGGNENSYAVLSGTRRVVAWGRNADGQLGDGTTAAKNTPIYVQTSAGVFLDQVIQIEGGDNFAVALRADGTVWTWGNNANGQLAQNNTTDYTYATQVFRDGARTIPLANIVKVTAGDTHVMALAADGTLWAWGGNWSGQLGTNTGGANLTLPGVVQTTPGNPITGVTAISAGNQHSMAVLSNGTLMTWGGTNNYQGQTGTGGGTNFPTAVPGLTNIVDVSDGDLWSFAVNASGTVYAFGQNTTDGYLGVNSTAATVPAPTAVTLPCGLTKACADAYLGPDITLCNPPSTTLYAPAGPTSATKYRWKRNGILLPDTTSSLFVNTAGTFRLIMWDSSYTTGCGYCVPDSDDVVITNASPATANNAYFCAPPCKNVGISVTGSSGNNYDWYANQYGGVALNGVPSSSYTTACISATTTYWAEDRATQRCTAGYSHGQAPLNTEGNQWYTNAENRMTFDVLTAFTLDSVTIKYNQINFGVCSGVPSAQGVFNILIKNSGGATIATINPLVPCGAGAVTVQIPIGYTFAVGAGYSLEFGGGAGTGVYYFSNGANYATVQECGWINFVGSSTADADDWPGFFSWKLRVGTNTCGRTPVQAILNCVLPVEFHEFTAKAAAGNVYLNWITSAEKNNHYFSIQRSSDGISFETIGKVDGSGTSTYINSYNYVDANPLGGTSYYRIEQHDFDGNVSYSELRMVSTESSHVVLYPNPFENQINIIITSDLSEDSKVIITDLTGKLILEQAVNHNEVHNIGENLSPGFYLAKVVTGSEVNVYKIEKLR
ncbi:MAG: T9SS type A sorting domain-containing protein [Cytophagaceae bacterium]|nr:T9SS type A sorting domain-containing protein [Cytophagaceae bacterium]